MATQSIFDLLQTLQKLYSEMALNAVRQNWLELPKQQGEANSLAALIQAQSWETISKGQRIAVSSMIEKILASQKTIKGEIADWQSDIAPLLASFDARPPGQ